MHYWKRMKDKKYEILVLGDWIPRSILGKCQALCAYIRMIYLIITYSLIYKKQQNVDLYIVDLIPISIPFLKLAKERVIYYCHHPDLLSTTRDTILKKIYRKPIDWLECKATKYSDITLVNSEYTASVFRETFPEIEIKIEVLYPTISLSLFEQLSLSKRDIKINSVVDNVPNNSLVFLSINRFHPAKRLEMAIEAMYHLKTRIEKSKWEQVYFIIAGGYDSRSSINASYFSELQKLASKLDLEKKIIFLKSPSDDVKLQLLLTCHCLIYTPVKEHFGIVPLEAMMAKLPVIACNSGGPRETVSHGQTGYLCETNSESLAEFVSKIIHDNNFQQMGEKGRERLLDSFSNEMFSNKLNQIVGDAIEC
ncbi:hypothetical protein WA026_011735 [Henosepilachna vigintioctopunctata]|uniref:Alpha-1,3/1,6-mannosyltransferase ALG2 n=1 Tax=Henosepilachna vigintioctopunctata TaxID=420089 RepID=A0AAW1UD82_9CUCU